MMDLGEICGQSNKVMKLTLWYIRDIIKNIKARLKIFS